MSYFVTIRLHFQRTNMAGSLAHFKIADGEPPVGYSSSVHRFIKSKEKKTKENKFAFTCKKLELKAKKETVYQHCLASPRVSCHRIMFVLETVMPLCQSRHKVYHNAMKQFTFLCWQQTLLVRNNGSSHPATQPFKRL